MTSTARHTWFTSARAVEPADRVDREGEAVVLMGTSVVRLSALAVAVVDACAQDWTDPGPMAQALTARFGAAGTDAEEATRRVLADLADEGLVELR